jgi:hypothetical protein
MEMDGIRRTGLLIGLAAMSLTVAAGLARAQDTAPPPPPAGGPGEHVMARQFGPGGDAIGFMGFEAGLAGKTVTNAPFTATVTTQVTRTLADGNKIDQTITGTVSRDSQGRTRRDMTLPGAVLAATTGGGAPRAVFINDPVAATSYILHPDSKVADQMRFRPMRGALRAFRNDVGIRGRRGAANETTTTELGTQTINGVMAQGTRITRTIPAGQIGNEKPIVIVTERWYSPALQMYVLRKTTNPLMGTTTFQLTNIQQAEPDPSLFQVPSDYTVRPGRMFRARGRNAVQAPDSQN